MGEKRSTRHTRQLAAGLLFNSVINLPFQSNRFIPSPSRTFISLNQPPVADRRRARALRDADAASCLSDSPLENTAKALAGISA